MEIPFKDQSTDSGAQVAIRPVGSYKEVEGNLIELALQGEFDVIAHGCNCHCVMGAGIAPQMAYHFACDQYSLEAEGHRGNFAKLGNIEFGTFHLSPSGGRTVVYTSGKINNKLVSEGYTVHYAVNCYTQYGFGSNHPGGSDIPLNYAALSLCLQKMNSMFKGKRIGLPLIGCGLAGGDWNLVKKMIKAKMPECFVTIVHYKPKEDGADTRATQVREADNGDRREQQ